MTVKGKYLYYLYGKLNGQKKNPCFGLLSFRRLRNDFTTVYFPEEYARICPRKASFGGGQANYCNTKKATLRKKRESEKAEDFASGSARNSASLSLSVQPYGFVTACACLGEA